MRRPEFVARQSALPSGLLGRLIGHLMARETAAVNEAAVELLDLRSTDDVLEVGFGHGATIERVAAAVRGGRVSGVDPSPEMCAMASRRNRRAIEAGRVALRQASAEDLPFPEASFDKVLLVHTVYFWPELAPAFGEIARVLRPAGCVVVAHRTDASAARDFPAPVYRFRSPAAVKEALEASGLGCDDAILRTFGGATICFHVARRRPALPSRQASPRLSEPLPGSPDVRLGGAAPERKANGAESLMGGDVHRDDDGRGLLFARVAR